MSPPWTIVLFQLWVLNFSLKIILIQKDNLSSIYFILYFEQSYDATTHFESTVDDVLNLYTKITGKVWVSIYLSLVFPLHTLEITRADLIVIATASILPMNPWNFEFPKY